MKIIEKFNISFIKKYKNHVIVYFISNILGDVLPLVLSFLIGQETELLIQLTGDLQNITFIILCIICYSIAIKLREYEKNKLQRNYSLDLSVEIYHSILYDFEHVLATHKNTGEFSEKINQYAEDVSTYFVCDFVSGASSLFALCLTIFSLSKYNRVIGIALLLIVTLVVFGQLKMTKKIEKAFVDTNNAFSSFFATLIENIVSIDQIRYNDLYSFAHKNTLDKGDAYSDKRFESYKLSAIITFIIIVIKYLLVAFYIILSINNTKRVGELVTVVSLFEVLFAHLLQTKSFLLNTQSFISLIKDIQEILVFEKNKCGSAISKEINIYSIDVVNFASYYQKGQPLNFTFSSGNVYYLVGDNGVGKSSFFNCLLGIDKNYNGDMKINNESIKNMNLEELYYKKIFYMDQNSEVLEYVDIETSNISLSRGERQQILINDILLDKQINNSLLLFDEPTASLDIGEKDKFIQLVNDLKNTNIILIITHDAFLLTDNSMIVRLE